MIWKQIIRTLRKAFYKVEFYIWGQYYKILLNIWWWCLSRMFQMTQACLIYNFLKLYVRWNNNTYCEWMSLRSCNVEARLKLHKNTGKSGPVFATPQRRTNDRKIVLYCIILYCIKSEPGYATPQHRTNDSKIVLYCIILYCIKSEPGYATPQPEPMTEKLVDGGVEVFFAS